MHRDAYSILDKLRLSFAVSSPAIGHQSCLGAPFTACSNTSGGQIAYRRRAECSGDSQETGTAGSDLGRSWRLDSDIGISTTITNFKILS